MINRDAVTTILFDVGGVLVQLKGLPFRPEWLTGENVGKEVLPFWTGSSSVREFERGFVDIAEFAKQFIEETGLSVDADTFLGHLLYWPNSLFDGVPEMLDRLSHQYRLAALSNSNAWHWPRMMTEFKLGEMIPDAISSHQIGVMKPDKRAFNIVMEKLGLKPEEILFLDDLQVSVDNAKSLGIQAVKVKGVEGAVGLVDELGLIDR